MRKRLLLVGFCLLTATTALAASSKDSNTSLAGTELLTMTGDFPTQMLAGINRYFLRETSNSIPARAPLWHRDFSSPEAYANSVAPNREHLRKIIGAVDPIVPDSRLEAVVDITALEQPRTAASWSATPVRWQVLDGVCGEGLLLGPATRPVACVVAIPDADQTPEMLCGLQPGIAAQSQFARVLVEQGCEVLVPALVSRGDEFSGNPKVKMMPNEPHREWISRAAFMMGRHIIGYEVERMTALVNCLAKQQPAGTGMKIGIAGYGEGGLIAFYTAALNTNIDAAMVSGYFAPREQLWQEPIYRNLFGLFREFGDAELASLVAPRPLIVEYSEAPKTPAPHGTGQFTPGNIKTPSLDAVQAEVRRANELVAGLGTRPIQFASSDAAAPGSFGSSSALQPLLKALGGTWRNPAAQQSAPAFTVAKSALDARQYRLVKELERHTQQLFHESDVVRNAITLDRLRGKPAESFEILKRNREIFWNDVIGKIERPGLPLKPRTRQIPELDQEKWTGYEVVLDVLPDVFGWGYLLVPKDLRPGERRPVVVCQHGLESTPESVIGKASPTNSFSPRLGATLANHGFIVFAPYAPFRGRDEFRLVQRKANPLGKSLFSLIIAQQDAMLDWLGTVPFVDTSRIAFYGNSYGGKTAMRVCAVLDRYCAVVCAADFNDWVAKNTSVDSSYSYVFMHEWELPEWNLGNTFSHAEMSSFIAPRPFMVEHGHNDPVAPDWWVGYEFAKTKLIYFRLGIEDLAQIDVFNGGHGTHGVDSFKFLHKYLNWPEPQP